MAIKNPGLIRTPDGTALQIKSVSQPIYIYSCTIPSYVSLANNVYDSNNMIIQIFWGICKYPLFLGFGWIFMPLMLTLQYIMSLNYVSTQKPLNLAYFLSSFSDYRNPSILFNPQRNNLDAKVLSHGEMYTVIPQFYQFDRGIDFLKNCFQFFFVPFLSFIAYLFICGFNKLLNLCCKKDIPFISEYIQPRLPLHLASYALVQAIPVSFFFFAQLNDTQYNNVNSPSASYPIFNIAMAYLAFFLTLFIPLVLMAFIYYVYSNREQKFSRGSQLVLVLTEMLQAVPTEHNRAFVNDPLWTQKTSST